MNFKKYVVIILLSTTLVGFTNPPAEGNKMNIEKMKKNAAKAALKYVTDDAIIGVGTGSTVNFFIAELAPIKHKVKAAVSSSKASTKLLEEIGIPVIDLNTVDELSIYVDGADAYNSLKQLIKGGGGALTQEKIVAAASTKFICILDASKKESVLGTTFPVPIEVIPSARSLVAREIVKLGGQPQYREHFITDNGNIILDVHNWEISEPIELENKINQITGVVSNGIFAKRPADVIIVGTENSVEVY